MWHKGYITINGIRYFWEAKVYDEPSELGINDGRISKLIIIRESYGLEIQASYCRGWDLEPTTPEAKQVLDIIMGRFT